jgi:hypothetical protein
MKIRELMSGGLVTVRRETPVLEAQDLMAREKSRVFTSSALLRSRAGRPMSWNAISTYAGFGAVRAHERDVGGRPVELREPFAPGG